ncbi:guanylate kinase [Desulfosarcina ovata]|uniref:Guanylate kinase n=1 Tax=Desulfosarcina ovata subsp. ovata TaxID=2752305 RepID=A0A5K8ANQ8_9BACT|nr:guanylate kinase [Desulfosarcina ovata]BBO93500.1 guanylate kinase [Desulfosarcina ovata subsp. ovata]
MDPMAPNDPVAPDKSAGSGRLFVVSAPSGAGKSTLCQAARKQLPDLVYSVSSTTRPPRSGEQDGRDYFFVSREDFQKGIDKGLWVEWAQVHDNYYGTSARFIDGHLAAGRDVLMDIDVQGARQILERYPQTITIFIMVPSMAALRQRLTARGQDDMDVIEKRLRNAKAEIAQKERYRYVVVNDDLPAAIDRFVRILKGEAD